jgi:uncharacterized protein (DUF885 family)
MHNRIFVHIAGATYFFIGVLFLVPSNSVYSQQDGDIQAILSDLQDLQFDDFIDASYKHILLRSPETVTSMGLSKSLGIRDDRLDNICYTYIDETYKLKHGIREILASHDRSGLDYDQRISYDSYSWLLSDWAAEQEYMYHFYPVTHGFSRQNDLFRFFADEQPLETLKNAQDYISRLSQVDDQFACLIQNLQDSEERGIMAPAQMLQRAADRIRYVVPGSAASLPLHDSGNKNHDDRRAGCGTKSRIAWRGHPNNQLFGHPGIPSAGSRIGQTGTASTGDERSMAASGW